MSAIGYKCVGGPWDGKWVARPDGNTSFKVVERCETSLSNSPLLRYWPYVLTLSLSGEYVWRAQA